MQTYANSTISTTATWLFGIVGQPIAYSMWVLCIFGIDPFDILINHGFVYFNLLTLYDF